VYNRRCQKQSALLDSNSLQLSCWQHAGRCAWCTQQDH
jgi:hypothetical protein